MWHGLAKRSRRLAAQVEAAMAFPSLPTNTSKRNSAAGSTGYRQRPCFQPKAWPLLIDGQKEETAEMPCRCALFCRAAVSVLRCTLTARGATGSGNPIPPPTTIVTHAYREGATLGANARFYRERHAAAPGCTSKEPAFLSGNAGSLVLQSAGGSPLCDVAYGLPPPFGARGPCPPRQRARFLRLTCAAPSCRGRSQPRLAPPRCAAGGYTWPRARCGWARRS